MKNELENDDEAVLIPSKQCENKGQDNAKDLELYERMKSSFNVLMIFCTIFLILYLFYFTMFNLNYYKNNRRIFRTVIIINILVVCFKISTRYHFHDKNNLLLFCFVTCFLVFFISRLLFSKLL